jgi:hypothetical protein
MCSNLNYKFDKKKNFPPLAHGHSPRRLGTETPGGGVQTQWLGKTILISKIKHGNKAPLELDLGSMCKQLVDKHCNFDQGQIKILKNFRLIGDPWAQPAHMQAHFGHVYLNLTNVGQAH